MIALSLSSLLKFQGRKLVALWLDIKHIFRPTFEEAYACYRAPKTLRSQTSQRTNRLFGAVNCVMTAGGGSENPDFAAALSLCRQDIRLAEDNSTIEECLAVMRTLKRWQAERIKAASRDVATYFRGEQSRAV